MFLTTKALVLRVIDYNDKDCLLSVLTPEHGKLTVKARGLRRKNSPLIAPCQLLCYAEFTLFDYRGMFTINEAQSLELFHGLRRDLNKLSLATYFAQVTELLSQEDMPSPELLALLLNCLYALDKLALPLEQIKAVFELRAAALAGYAPDLSVCAVCGSATPDRFDISSGQLVCHGCAQADGGIRMPITPSVLQAMRYIIFCHPKKLFSFRLEDAAFSRLSDITEGYLCARLERGFSALDFYKSLNIGENHV